MTDRAVPSVRVSARFRLALSYAVFLVAAGAVLLFGVYVVLRYVPDYPLTASNPRDSGGTVVATRGEILGAVVGVSGFALLGLAVIGMVGGWFLAGWILKPLRRINEAAQIAATGDLEHRIRLSGRNDEFRQLADSFDDMLDKLRDAFHAHERFAANASHELRTPLAVTSTMLDVASRNPHAQDYPELLERLTITNDRAIGLTESLLRLADANEITALAEPVDLAGIVRTTLAENADEAGRRSVTITPLLQPAQLVGDPVLLHQLVTNLVQNAIRHSGTDRTGGTAGAATIRTETDHLQTVILRVESTGRVFDTETASRLAEPFLRGAGRTAHGDHGYGLGLALVHRIAAVLGGSLTIAPRAEGGLFITVEFPTTPH
ncbi:sensor histidine kinase [Herbiconiux sp. P15]|uniref:sensor histidine kinase n=1 Tax=Herbiconiux liukaitaii TaxID=3342799 RepID=UPI0035B6E913